MHPSSRTAAGQAHGPFTMGYYTRDDISYHFALADAFTICGNYHCSVFGPTHPNRILAISGPVDPDGKAGGPVVHNSVPASDYGRTTYPERLQAAGISWKYRVANPIGTDLAGSRSTLTPSPATRCMRT
jgi:phospholipase C